MLMRFAGVLRWAPSPEQGRRTVVAYHNLLMNLCQVGERQLRNLLIQNAVPRPEAPVE